jgi:hypothetical protein
MVLAIWVVIIIKIKIALLCFDRIGMLVFHTFLSFFAGGFSMLEYEDKESRLIEMTLFWDLKWLFPIWSLKFLNPCT